MHSRPHLLAAAVLAVGLAPAVSSQSNWRQGPGGVLVSAHASAYDEARGEVVVFGGAALGSPLTDATWVWNGVDWRRVTPAQSPSARRDVIMAYDAARERVVLFGGVEPGGVNRDDTWEWDGTDWTQRFPTRSPGARHAHAMAYDSARGRVLLFGGFDGSLLGDTWEWDGTNWTERQPAVAATPRSSAALAYDAHRNRAVLFGGYGDTVPCRSDTWEWDGLTWTQVPTSTGPSLRTSHRMAYDAARRRVVLFGGRHCDPPTVEYDETWEWDGTVWVERVPLRTPGSRGGHGMVYDTLRRRVVVTGGLSCVPCGTLRDTWLYEPTTPAQFDRFGVGCAGSAGVLQLAAVGGSLPWLGDTLELSLSGVPAGVASAGVLGASDQVWGALPLPVSLGLIGAAGCELLVSLDVAVVLASAGGVAGWSVPLPLNPVLVGQAVFAQGVTLGDPVNPARLVTSNAGAAVIGTR
ncbi:MAG: kelch repeat-containing protein [Planctomycetota bacterium]